MSGAETFFTGNLPYSDLEQLELEWLHTPLPADLRAEVVKGDFLEFQRYTFGVLAAMRPDSQWEFVYLRDARRQGLDRSPAFLVGLFEGSGGSLAVTESRANARGEQRERFYPRAVVRMGPCLLDYFQKCIGDVVTWREKPYKNRGTREYSFSGLEARALVKALYVEGVPYVFRAEAKAILTGRTAAEQRVYDENEKLRKMHELFAAPKTTPEQDHEMRLKREEEQLKRDRLADEREARSNDTPREDSTPRFNRHIAKPGATSLC